MASRARGLDISWNLGIVHLSEVKAGRIFLKGMPCQVFLVRQVQLAADCRVWVIYYSSEVTWAFCSLPTHLGTSHLSSIYFALEGQQGQ